MPLQKLTNTTAFIARDFGDAPSLASVRLAPKVLQRSAWEMARALTYQAAILELQMGGASAGISAAPEDRGSAIEAFVAETEPQVQDGSLVIDAAKGVAEADLGAFRALDPRPAHRWELAASGLPGWEQTQVEGIVAAARAAAGGQLDGKRVSIEGFDHRGPELSRLLTSAGCTVTAVGAAGAARSNPGGFELDELVNGWTEHGPKMLANFSGETTDSAIVDVEVDLLLVGSKMGVIDHKVAEQTRAAVVIPIGVVPYTTKAAVMLQRQGSVVVPDFVALAGATHADWHGADAEPEAARAASIEAIESLTASLIDDPAGPIVGACQRAEAFMESWREERPFGRPFAP